MARELVVMLWCDFCAEIDQIATTGEEHVYSLDGGKPKALVACEVHHKEFVAPLLDALERIGIPAADIPAAPKAAKAPKVQGAERRPMMERPADPVKCMLCERVFGEEKILKNGDVLNVHRKQFHGVGAMEYRAFLRGDAKVISKDEETQKIELEVTPLPPAGEPYDIPADYRCGIGDCPSVFDPRDFSAGEDGAFRAVSGHRNSTHKAEMAARKAAA